MRRSTWLVAVLCVVVGLAATASVAAPPPAKIFVAKLRGGQENPAVETGAVGQVVLTLRNGTLRFRLSATNIDDVMQAHIHCGARGVNGPVVAFLYSGATIDPHGLFSRGTVTVTPVGDSAECPGGVANLSDLLAKMRSGNAYANVHTVSHPAGEIRGQIRPNKKP